MKALKNLSAVVTGGTKGIGREIVRKFVTEGARVVTCSLGGETERTAVEQLCTELGESNFAYLKADMERIEDIDRLAVFCAATFGPPRILVNNAAKVVLRSTLDATIDDFDTTMSTNARAYWYLARSLAAAMKEAGGGTIVNIGSTHILQTRISQFPYNVSKGAISTLTRVLAVEFGGMGIRVNSVLPGIVRTDNYEILLNSLEDPERQEREILESHPLLRLPSAAEVANAVAFLCSKESSGITGIELIVDAGRQALRVG